MNDDNNPIYPKSTEKFESLELSDKISIMNMIHKHYMMDVEQIWKRGSVFLAISSGLIALLSSGEYKSDFLPKIYYILFGFIISLAWCITSWKSHVWITVWRNKLVELDKYTNPLRSFSDGEMVKGNAKAHLHRPQTYAAILSTIFAFFWFCILLAEISRSQCRV